eukprot:4645813-Amphidinium_carterae.1
MELGRSGFRGSAVSRPLHFVTKSLCCLGLPCKDPVEIKASSTKRLKACWGVLSSAACPNHDTVATQPHCPQNVYPG